MIWKLAQSITLCDGRYLLGPNETAAFRSFFFFQRCLVLKRLQHRTLTVQNLPPTAAWLSCRPTNWFCCSQSRLIKQNALSLFNCQSTPSHCKCLTLFWRSQGRPNKFGKIYPKSLSLMTCNLGWLQASLSGYREVYHWSGCDCWWSLEVALLSCGWGTSSLSFWITTCSYLTHD